MLPQLSGKGRLGAEAQVQTFIIIARNSAIIIAALAVFAGLGVLISTWLSDNSHEAHPEH